MGLYLDPSEHALVQAWLTKHPRFVMHFTLTSASWLNMVERFFRVVSENGIKRDSFASVADLEQAVNDDIEHHDTNPKPFIWTAIDSTSCDVSIGCSPGRVWETGVTTLQSLQKERPGEQSQECQIDP